jgi:hypothetical protein
LTEENRQRPIAICRANEVEAWYFPFFLRPASDLEPAFLFLEDHLYNMTADLEGVLVGMVRIDSEEDLKERGYFPGEDGIYYL